MTENEYAARFDFLSERKLSRTDAALHKRFRDSVFSTERLLANYKNIFPFFTDHTFEHSEHVIHYCNVIAGEEIIDALNPDEIYILLMGATLHDIGMGVSEADFHCMRDKVPGLDEYISAHPDEPIAEYTREFHQALSAEFIRKYSPLFDIPSPEHTYCIAQVAKGHRRADLLDKSCYAPDYTLPGGRQVNLAYLAALVKLADELDVTADRNLLFDYKTVSESWSEKQTMCYKCHGAIKRLGVRCDSLVLFYDTDEAPVEEEIMSTRSKVNKTFAEYREVVEKRTSFPCRIKNIVFEKEHK